MPFYGLDGKSSSDGGQGRGVRPGGFIDVFALCYIFLFGQKSSLLMWHRMLHCNVIPYPSRCGGGPFLCLFLGAQSIPVQSFSLEPTNTYKQWIDLHSEVAKQECVPCHRFMMIS